MEISERACRKKWHIKMEQQPRKLIRPKIKLRDVKVNHGGLFYSTKANGWDGKWMAPVGGVPGTRHILRREVLPNFPSSMDRKEVSTELTARAGNLTDKWDVNKSPGPYGIHLGVLKEFKGEIVELMPKMCNLWLQSHSRSSTGKMPTEAPFIRKDQGEFLFSHQQSRQNRY